MLVPAPGYGGPDAPANPNAVTVHQDAAMFATLLAPAQAVTHRFRQGFDGYLFVVHGEAHVATDDDAGELDTGRRRQGRRPSREVSVRARDAGAQLLLVETRRVTR